MRVRVLVPEVEIGGQKYTAGDTLTVTDETRNEVERLLRSWYVHPEEGEGQAEADPKPDTVLGLRATLDAAGVEYPKGAKKAELAALVEALNADEALADDEAEEA